MQFETALFRLRGASTRGCSRCTASLPVAEAHLVRGVQGRLAVAALPRVGRDRGPQRLRVRHDDDDDHDTAASNELCAAFDENPAKCDARGQCVFHSGEDADCTTVSTTTYEEPGCCYGDTAKTNLKVGRD